MKKIILVVTILFSVATTIAQDKKNSLKVNPFGLLLGSPTTIAYERALTENFTAFVFGGFGCIRLDENNYNYYNFIGAGLQTRYYFSQALESWYGGVKYSYSSAVDANVPEASGNISESNTDATSAGYTLVRYGVIFGYQWVYDSGFTIDLNIGAAQTSLKAKASASDEKAGGGFSKVLPGGSFALGYTF